MGSYINFKNCEDTIQPDSRGGRPPGNFSLARQSSIYTLTFDEFQNTLGGFGKDFGSMNMDELLKNIWTAEETQATASSIDRGDGSVPGGNLQRQGSLTLPLPRTLSQKTVDEVWKDLLKENSGVKDGGGGGSHLPQRQPTLGEMTLEDFLFRAGVVREGIQPTGRPNNGGFYGEMLRATTDNTGLTLGFQQVARDLGVLDNQITRNNNVVPNSSSNTVLNAGGLRTSQQDLQQQQVSHPLFSEQADVAFTSPMHLVNNSQLASEGANIPIVQKADPSVNSDLVHGGVIQSGEIVMTGLGSSKVPIIQRADPSVNSALVHGGVVQSGAIGMTGLGTGSTTLVGGTHANRLPPDATAKSNLDTSSLSPSPYAFNEGLGGRKGNNTLEKVVERRRRRMIKNRESAARSRARKQLIPLVILGTKKHSRWTKHLLIIAYTLELEAELAKLKEINQDLQKKQAEFMELQKNEFLETMNKPWGGKRRCLRRTLTGPW